MQNRAEKLTTYLLLPLYITRCYPTRNFKEKFMWLVLWAWLALIAWVSCGQKTVKTANYFVWSSHKQKRSLEILVITRCTTGHVAHLMSLSVCKVPTELGRIFLDPILITTFVAIRWQLQNNADYKFNKKK